MASVHSSSFEFFEPRARSLMHLHPQDDGTNDDNLSSSILSNAPKLSTRSETPKGVPKELLSGDLIFSMRQVSNGQEELYARGKCVYWTRNNMIVKSFNFTEQVIRVEWCQFSKKDHICIALTSGLSIFNHIGQHFQIPLPFVYVDMYPTSFGLIIERNHDSQSDSSLPILFALTDPTKEISPILFRSSSGLLTYRQLTYSMPSSTIIAAQHDKLPLLLLYNSQDCEHSIWKIRLTTTDEIDEFQRMNDESTTNMFINHQSSCSFREGLSQNNLSLSSRQRSSFMHQSNTSSTSTLNFSTKMDLRSRSSALGNLAASRLGVGGGQLLQETNLTKSFNSAQNMNIMSTPNRNRIINYLRDNIEEPILPELTLDRIWNEPSNDFSEATDFFSSPDLFGNDFIVIVTAGSNQVRVTKCDISTDDGSMIFGQTSFINAVDALAIPDLKMMITRDCRNILNLYSGTNFMTKIDVSPLSNRPLSMIAMTPRPRNWKENKSVQMSSIRKGINSADRQLSSSDISIQQMFKSFSPVKNKHKSVSKSLIDIIDINNFEQVIGQTVFVQTYNSQRYRFTVPSICQTLNIKRLLDAITSVVSKELGLILLSKWYQTRRSIKQPDLMSARSEMKLFKSWFLNCMGISSNYFEELKSEDESPVATSMNPPSQIKKLRKIREPQTNSMTRNAHSLLFAMHLVFEDLLLMKLNYESASDIVELLLVLAYSLRLDEYQEYYIQKFPHLQEKFGQHKTQLETYLFEFDIYRGKPPIFQSHPPSVIDFISKIIIRSKLGADSPLESVLPYPIIANATDNVYTILSLFCEMFNVDRSKALSFISSSSTSYAEIDIFAEKPFRSRAADERVVTLMAELNKTSCYLSCLPEAINLYLWDAILNCRESPPTNWSESCFELIGRMDLVSLVRGRTNMAPNQVKTKKKEGLNQDDADDHDDDDDDDDEETLKLIFPHDIRVSEARNMLASDIPVEFSITQRQGATEEESRDETHRHLYLLNVRTMAIPVGRGALCLRTYSPVIGESFEVPRLDLSGKASSEERPIEYTHDISVYPWPFFHNGVAAGLTICASTANNIIDSTWINYNRPRSNIAHGADVRDRDLTAANINNEHAGFLFALGLNGHLEKLSLMALHDYLCQNNDLTKLAILLGMSAAKRGSRDNNIIKVLSIHVDALLPPNSTELDVSAPVHAASIIGVGLLYQGSGDSHISKVLLEEIGRLPGPETNSHVDRESYSLSAGLSFGLVNLCKGGSSTISSSDQLRLYMLGGKRKEITPAQRERYFKQDCHRGEEEYINTHITSPGGTLGLGLMYHRSGNQSVADWMRAPDTQTLLENVRPDFLILRMLSYGLIMWNEIKASEDWINSLIPKIVSKHAFQRNLTPNSATLVASTCSNQTVDYELISQAYCNIVAGCCMSIAMRFAGTADRNAYKTIYKHTAMLIALSNKPALAEQAGRPCIEACLNVLVTSLAVVMAGTGDKGVMRVCRYLRSRLTQSCVFYGSYMALHMALGILFLGACRYSLSTSPESIGALVCALYPIYPNHSSDNRYHLQALRHLYVLASEPRLLIPRDIQTNKPVYVKLIVKQRQESGNVVKLELEAPCLMPEVNSIDSVYVEDDRYWRIEINNKEALKRCLFQDKGYLSVKKKTHSSKNKLVQNIETWILQNMPRGEMKSRKMSALNECIKEDRVEQYSALNELLTRTNKVDSKYKNIVVEQIRLASTLADSHLGAVGLLLTI